MSLTPLPRGPAFDHQGCVIVHVPADACYVRFSHDPVAESQASFITSRGEAVIVDLDAYGGLVGLELLKGDKPCRDGGPITLVQVDTDGTEHETPLSDLKNLEGVASWAEDPETPTST